MRYNPRSYWGGIRRDQTNPAEIAEHRPVLATRYQSEPSWEEQDECGPLATLRGQPGVLEQDESYHHGEAVRHFNEELRAHRHGHIGISGVDPEE
jgi:hypothetical protein